MGNQAGRQDTSKLAIGVAALGHLADGDIFRPEQGSKSARRGEATPSLPNQGSPRPEPQYNRNGRSAGSQSSCRFPGFRGKARLRPPPLEGKTFRCRVRRRRSPLRQALTSCAFAHFTLAVLTIQFRHHQIEHYHYCRKGERAEDDPPSIHLPIKLRYRFICFTCKPFHVAHSELHPNDRQPACPGKEIQCQRPFYPVVA
jgi:hypothetical protein